VPVWENLPLTPYKLPRPYFKYTNYAMFGVKHINFLIFFITFDFQLKKKQFLNNYEVSINFKNTATTTLE